MAAVHRLRNAIITDELKREFNGIAQRNLVGDDDATPFMFEGFELDKIKLEDAGAELPTDWKRFDALRIQLASMFVILPDDVSDRLRSVMDTVTVNVLNSIISIFRSRTMDFACEFKEMGGSFTDNFPDNMFSVADDPLLNSVSVAHDVVKAVSVDITVDAIRQTEQFNYITNVMQNRKAELREKVYATLSDTEFEKVTTNVVSVLKSSSIVGIDNIYSLWRVSLDPADHDKPQPNKVNMFKAASVKDAKGNEVSLQVSVPNVGTPAMQVMATASALSYRLPNTAKVINALMIDECILLDVLRYDVTRDGSGNSRTVEFNLRPDVLPYLLPEATEKTWWNAKLHPYGLKLGMPYMCEYRNTAGDWIVARHTLLRKIGPANFDKLNLTSILKYGSDHFFNIYKMSTQGLTGNVGPDALRKTFSNAETIGMARSLTQLYNDVHDVSVGRRDIRNDEYEASKYFMDPFPKQVANPLMKFELCAKNLPTGPTGLSIRLGDPYRPDYDGAYRKTVLIAGYGKGTFLPAIIRRYGTNVDYWLSDIQQRVSIESLKMLFGIHGVDSTHLHFVGDVRILLARNDLNFDFIVWDVSVPSSTPGGARYTDYSGNESTQVALINYVDTHNVKELIMKFFPDTQMPIRTAAHMNKLMRRGSNVRAFLNLPLRAHQHECWLTVEKYYGDYDFSRHAAKDVNEINDFDMNRFIILALNYKIIHWRIGVDLRHCCYLFSSFYCTKLPLIQAINWHSKMPDYPHVLKIIESATDLKPLNKMPVYSGGKTSASGRALAAMLYSQRGHTKHKFQSMRIDLGDDGNEMIFGEDADKAKKNNYDADTENDVRFLMF